jgi:hypothetical protein
MNISATNNPTPTGPNQRFTKTITLGTNLGDIVVGNLALAPTGGVALAPGQANAFAVDIPATVGLGCLQTFTIECITTPNFVVPTPQVLSPQEQQALAKLGMLGRWQQAQQERIAQAYALQETFTLPPVTALV